MSDDHITLRCSHCGNTQSYPREVDPVLPKEVVLIVTSECNRCEADDGGFSDEQWFDSEGKEIIA
jgi:hypothetical protein